MSQAETQQGFPKVPAQFVNADLTINEVWLRVLISLWNRTGGAPGASTNEALIWAISGEEMPRESDSESGGGGGFSSDVLFGGASASLDQQALSPTALAEMPWTPPGDLLISSLLEPAPTASSGGGNTTALTDNHIFVGNATNVATDVAMSGDATIVASGALTFATVNSNVGVFGDATHVAQVTLNAKGLVTAAAAVAITPGSASLTTNHIFVGNGSNVATDVAMSGDATIVASGALTLANTAVTPATYGDSSHVAQVTVDSKGRITAAANVAITGGGSATNTATLSVPAPTTAGALAASVGEIFTPTINMQVTGLGIVMTTVTGGVYKFGIAPYNRGTNQITSAPTYTPSYTEAAGAIKSIFENFASLVSLTAGTSYIVFVVRTDSTAGVSQTIGDSAANCQAPGIYLASTAGVSAYQLASLSPTTSDTWSSSGGGVWSVQMVYTL